MNDPAFRDTNSGVAYESTLELGRFDPPLLAAARDRLDQDVAVHIAGGISVDGRLTAINDDSTITVVDKSHRYDIALDAVAVIEGSRT